MPRLIALFLCFGLSAAQAASLKDFELNQMLIDVARKSSVGTPRAINQDITDQGYTAEGDELINHLSVRRAHAEQMRANPNTVRHQLKASVCGNHGYRQLLDKGAVLRYEFRDEKSGRPVTTLRFKASDCAP